MENIFTKVLRRLHRMGILPGAVHAIYRICSNRKVLDIPTERAWEQVHAITPRPEGSALWQMPNNEKSVFDVSVIIPFYKTEQYAVQCIESVLTQDTDYRMEVILVDDGSPDRCGEILDSYVGRENVVVIHQQNQGVSVARNKGIAAAQSPYLMFVDSDDYLAAGAVQTLMTAAHKYDADMVEGSHQMVTTDGRPIQNQLLESAVGKQGAGMTGYPWGKVLRKSLFQNVCFPAQHWFEDAIMASLIFPLAGTTATVSDLVLYYRQNPAGISKSSVGNPKSLHALYIAEQMMDAFRKLGLNCSGMRQQLLVMELSRVLLTRISHFRKADIQAIFVCACDIAQHYHILPEGPTGNYFYDEIVEALRHRQYSRWKWASMLI